MAPALLGAWEGDPGRCSQGAWYSACRVVALPREACKSGAVIYSAAGMGLAHSRS